MEKLNEAEKPRMRSAVGTTQVCLGCIHLGRDGSCSKQLPQDVAVCHGKNLAVVTPARAKQAA